LRARDGEKAGSAEPDAKHPKPDPDDPFNYHDVEHAWARIDGYHRESLKAYRGHEGRFNPDVIGKIPVKLTKGAEAGTGTVPLHELAMVLPPQGRTIELRLHAARDRKAILSAVQEHPDFNQQPQTDPEDDMVLRMKVEPESAADTLRRLRDLCTEWREQVRRVTRHRQQAHKDWARGGKMLADAKRRADTEVQKLQDKHMLSIDQAENQVKRDIEARKERML